MSLRVLLGVGTGGEPLVADCLAECKAAGITPSVWNFPATPPDSVDAFAVICLGGTAGEVAGVARKFTLPVFAVPVGEDPASRLAALKSLAATNVAGVLAAGGAGAKNAALAALALAGRWDPEARKQLAAFRSTQTGSVLGMVIPDDE